MPREILHAVVLVIAIALTFLFPKTPLVQYDLQFTALLFIVLFLTKKFAKTGALLESVIFTLIIFTIINTTGGVSSPFFFLIYFLLFSLTLLLEPIISIVTTLTAIVFFILTMEPTQNFADFLPILSIAFITPFALFMGREHMRSEKLKVKNEKLQADTFLFLSLMLKNHLKNIKNSIENFMGDHELDEIKKSSREMERMIEKFEKETS